MLYVIKIYISNIGTFTIFFLTINVIFLRIYHPVFLYLFCLLTKIYLFMLNVHFSKKEIPWFVFYLSSPLAVPICFSMFSKYIMYIGKIEIKRASKKKNDLRKLFGIACYKFIFGLYLFFNFLLYCLPID